MSEHFNYPYPQQPMFPQQELKKGERIVMRKRKNFWGEEITEFYVAKHIDDSPFYKLVMTIFFLSLVMFFITKCSSEPAQKEQPEKEKTEKRVSYEG